MKIDLKPCPFCGCAKCEISYLYEDVKGTKDLYYIRCCKCKSTTDVFGTEEKAINAWNRRVDNG